MSAIFGIFRIRGEPVEEEHLHKMRDVLAGYGGGGQDILVERNTGLGCRLSGLGVCCGSDLPVCAGADIVLVCDALIWNRAELIEKLGLSDSVSTQGLLLEAYKKWGEDCPKQINGDFAFAVWEKRKNRLFLARDHLGVRPLYYFYDGLVLAFATDCRALLCLPFVGKQLDEIILYSDLSHTYHIDPEATGFKHIRRLPQAHTLRAEGNGIRNNKYWSPGAGEKIIYRTEEEYAKALYDIAEDSIRLRLRGVSGGIGAELSGGLDSSVITILANRELGKTGGKLEEVFSWSPPFELAERKPEDERDLIGAVCSQEKICCTHYDPRKFLPASPTLPPEAAYGNDVLHRELAAMSGKGARFALSGWGGDHGISHPAGLYELFMSGYFGYFIKQAWWLSKGSLPDFIRIAASNTVMQWFRPYSYFGNPCKGIPDILNGAFAKRMKGKCKKNIIYSIVDPVKYLESGAVQERTELLARLDAGYGIQHLYPFLDFRAVDFAMSVPRPLFYKRGVKRYIYRKAFADILPEQFDHYFTKDDAAKTAYYRKRALDNPERLKNAANAIDRNLFSPYIDWEKLEKAIGTSSPKDDSGRYPILKMKIQACLDIQQNLAEAKS